MNEQLMQKDLVQQYKGFLAILDSKGIAFDPIGDEALEKLPLPDLKRLVQHARDLARTPTGST